MVYAWLHGTNISGVDLSTANLDKIWTKQLVADNVTIPIEFSV